MKRGFYYHFLESKEQESENIRLGVDRRFNEWEFVEKNSRHPHLLHLFPWEIRKLITPHDLVFEFGLELNSRQVNEYLIIHWNSETKESLFNGEQIPVLMHDLDTKDDYRIYLKKWPNRERYVIQGYQFREFSVRRNLAAGMTVGMYWDIKSGVLRLSILESL